MLAVHRPDVSEDVAVLRIDEAIETGAVSLISGCPRCDETFKKAMAARGTKDIKVVNLVELVAQAAGII
jgi:Fe-S oxidoreductase